MRRSAVFFATGALAFSGLAGCETSSPPMATAGDVPSQCFDRQQIVSLMPQTSRSLDVVTSGGEAYELTLGSSCLDLQAQSRPVIKPRTGDRICGTGDADVFYAGSNIPQECRVTVVRRLSAEEAAKLK